MLNNIRQSLFYTLILFCSKSSLSQLFISNQGGTANSIVASMIGGGLTVSNATISCPSSAYGTFTNGSTTNIGIPSGIVLTTGNVNTLNGTGGTFWSSQNGSFCNDPQLQTLEPLAQYDCCILEFDVVPSCSTLRIRFVFGSEEYPEWVSAGYNDAFGFFITGPNPSGGNYANTNVATLPNNSTIVSIDNVNANLNSAYYVNNATGSSIVLDAFTSVLIRDVNVTPCQSYHFKLAIADAGDPIFDSGVFIDFLDCLNAATASTSSTPVSCTGNDGTATATVSAGFPPYTYSWNTIPPQITATATGLAPGTYIVTVDDAGSCTPPLTQTVTVGTNTTSITPTFNQIPSICSGGLFSLPNTSTNGITGTWSPSINNSQTTTYTFTPNPNQCAVNQTMTVVVNQPLIPNFNQISPICSGGSFNLPTTSTNGISGSWSPTINTTINTTYTFTPLASQCATIATMSVVVNPNIASLFTQVAPICSGDSFTLSSNSNNGITGSWSPAINNLATTTYTFTPTTGQCATNETMTVSVNQPTLPNFSQVGPICVGDSFVLPTASLNGVSGTWSPAINNSATTSYTFTPNSGQCASLANMIVNVGSPVIPNFAQISPICSGGSFNLPLTSIEGISGSWSPAINNTATTSYTFTPAVGQCAVLASMSVDVNPNVTPTFTQLPSICSGENITLLGTSNNGITGSWSPAINNLATTTYTFTPTTGQCATNETMTVSVNQPTLPNFSQVGPICSGDSFVLPTSSLNGVFGTWSPAINNSATTSYTFTPNSGQCASLANMTVFVGPQVTPTFNQWGPYCQNDIIIQVILPETSNEGISGTWNPAMVSTSVSGNIVHTFTPSNGQCANSTTMTVSVNQQLNTSFSQLPPICEGELFVLPSSSIEGINGTWSPSINNLVTTTYIFTPNTGECATEASLTVNVNPNPIISAGIPQIVCIGDLITLQGTGAGVGGTYTWSNNVINNVPFNVNETNTYNLVGTDVNGCSGSASITITALPYPNAQFGASPNQGEVALLVQFTNSSQNANNYLWDFGNGQNVQVNDLSNQQTIYNEPGQYTVWLIASNGYCIDSTSTVITVLAEPWIFVPNVFSPNEDGANELWMIDTKNINSIELIILNRWGNVMAKISDIEGGWDGKTLNGSDATEGTYFYKYEAKATNGKDFSGHGFLTLIR